MLLMPELPEVETVRKGLLALLGKKACIEQVRIRQRQLRYPVPKHFARRLRGAQIQGIHRRAKYLIWDCGDWQMLNHLGMTGSWRIAQPDEDLRKHDHCIITLTDGRRLIYHDPRRFGMLDVYAKTDPEHKLLAKLGPEPIDRAAFNLDYLYAACRKRKAAIKHVIMDQAVVVGVGNIYASESLFRARIHPKRSAQKVSKQRLAQLIECIQSVLESALAAGGSTISDFKQAGGSEGYFQHQFQVYERDGEACVKCGAAIKSAMIGQRNSYWCPACQH